MRREVVRPPAPSPSAAAVALAALLVGALLGRPARAQAPDSVVTLPAIDVVATPFIDADDAGGAVTRLVRDEQRRAAVPALTLDALTTTVPGLAVQDRGTYALEERLTVRGLGWRAAFGVRGVHVLLDGLPLTVADGQTMLTVLDPAFVREAEVIRGPASALWGNSAGGVVALSTLPPAGAPPARLRVFGGAYGTAKVEGEATVGTGDRRMHAYASGLRRDGFRAHSAVRLLRAGAAGTRPLGRRTTLRAAAALAHQPRADHPGSLAYDAFVADDRQARAAFVAADAGKAVTHVQGGASVVHRRGGATWQVQGHGLVRELENPLPFATIGLDRRAGGLRATMEGEAAGWAWGGGLDARLQHDDRRETAPDDADVLLVDQTETVRNAAVFGRAARRLGAWRASAGLRLDAIAVQVDDALPADRDGDRLFVAWSPAVGVRYERPGRAWYANLRAALQAPTTTELGNRPDGGSGFNPDLRPERIRGLETGVRGLWAPAGLWLDVAVFAQRVDGLLLPFQPGDDGPTYYRNTGQTRHVGAETAVEWARGAWEAAASHTFLRATFHDAVTAEGQALDGLRVPGVPAHQVGAEVRWRGPVVLDARLRAAGATYGDDLNTGRIDGYAVVHLGASHPGLAAGGVRWQPFASLQNAFDARYAASVSVNAFGARYYEPGAGRHLLVGLSMAVE